MHKEFRVVVVDNAGGIRVVGSPPYTKEATASRVRSLWRNMLAKRGVVDPDVRVQATDVEWVDA